MPTQSDIRTRTTSFSIRIIRLYGALPKSVEAQVLGKQILRSGTSVGAHVREAKHSRSGAEMLSKIDVALQELEETLYWMELLVASGIVSSRRLSAIQQEASELMSILFSSMKTLKGSRQRS
jgi:four helix bundle protein